MNKKSWFSMSFVMIFSILLLILTAGLTSLVHSGQPLKQGDVVYAEWVKNGWYHGRIAHACKGGWFIHFDDGDKKCCWNSRVVKDVIPDMSQVDIGTKVLALWKDGRYYPGVVAEINAFQQKFYIHFDDGDRGYAGINHIRIMQVPHFLSA